eukprot:2376109-Pyramimonas_sp.AAC.1
MNTLEEQVNSGLNTAQETALFARLEAKILGSQSQSDVASTRSGSSSVASHPRWRGRSAGPSPSASFTGTVSVERGVDPTRIWIGGFKAPMLARVMTKYMQDTVIPHLPSHIKPPSQIIAHNLNKAFCV